MRSLSLRLRGIPLAYLMVLASIPVVFVAQPAQAAPVDCSRGTNLGFETPLVRDDPMGPPPNWALFDESLVPGWDTSAADNMIELWESTFLGVTSYAGDQHAEMNANIESILSQSFPTLEGDSIDWFVAHRGRGGTESADLRFGAPGAPVVEATLTSGTGAWSTYSDTYVVPAGQTTTVMSFDSLVGGSVGNFLDGIELELVCELTIDTTFLGFIDNDADTIISPGDDLNFSYFVENVGSATLQNLSVVDALGHTVSCPTTTLMPGESTTCTGTYTFTDVDADNESVTSDATATGTDAAGVNTQDNDTEVVDAPGRVRISLDKSGTLDDTVVPPPGIPNVGDEINYTFDVTNTGTVTLSSITVTDPTAGTVSCPGSSLARGASMICTATLVLTQADIDAGVVDNTATAEGTFKSRMAMDTASDSVTLTADPEISVVKVGTIDDTVVGPPGRVDAGDIANYTVTVTNTGNVTLDPVEVHDMTAENFSCPSTSLAAGEAMDCLGDNTITQQMIDAGSVTNAADAEGTPPSGSSVFGEDVLTLPIEQFGIIGIAKELTSATANPDGTMDIDFLYTLVSYGNVTMDDIVVTDDVVGLFAAVSPSVFSTSDGTLVGSATWDGTASSNILLDGQSLAPGETATVSASFTVIGSANTTIDNTSFVTADAPDGTPYTDESANGTNPNPSGTGDPNDDTSPTPVEVRALYDLSIAKEGIDETTSGDVTWLVTVSNAGPSTAPGVITVTDTPGANLTVTAASGTGWDCAVAAGSATCTNAGGIPSGGSSMITVVTNTTATDGSTVTNTATVTPGDDNDVGPGNNAVSADVVVGGLPFTGVTTERAMMLAGALILLGLILTRVSTLTLREQA